MSTKRNTTAIYIIVIAVIIIAFLLLGGGPWMRNGIMHGSRSMGIAYLNWTQILIGAGIGFLIGFLVAKRKR